MSSSSCLLCSSLMCCRYLQAGKQQGADGETITYSFAEQAR